jgi:broad specificity phosphatase PhoE
LELLEIGCRSKMPWKDEAEACAVRTEATIEVTQNIREWDYGDYEGLTSATIQKNRTAQGLDPNWNIWSEGCPGGEYVYPIILMDWRITNSW